MNLHLSTFGFNVIEYNLSYPNDISEGLSRKYDQNIIYDKANLLYIALTIGDNEITEQIDIDIIEFCLNSRRIVDSNFLNNKELAKYNVLIHKMKQDLGLL